MMAGSVSAEGWLDQRRWDALEEALKVQSSDISMREALSEGAEKISWKNSAIFSIVRRQRQKK